MHAFHESAARGEFVSLESACSPPEPLPAEWPAMDRTAM